MLFTTTDKHTAPSPTAVVRNERRLVPRWDFRGDAEITTGRVPGGFQASLRNLSTTGCFLETRRPLSCGEAIQVRFDTGSSTLELKGIIRRVEPGSGVGVQFVMSEHEPELPHIPQANTS